MQSQHEFREGNYGYAAHNSMQGKSIKRYKIPNKENHTQVKQFNDAVHFIIPHFGIARLDEIEENKVNIQIYNDYKNYKNIVGQVPKNSLQEKALQKYFGNLYKNRNEIFESNGEVLDLIIYDINEYLDSEEFKEILNVKKPRGEEER